MKVYKRTKPVVLAHRLPVEPHADLSRELLTFAGENMLSISRLPSGNYVIKRLSGAMIQKPGFPGWWIVLDDGLQVLDHETFLTLYEVPADEAAVVVETDAGQGRAVA